MKSFLQIGKLYLISILSYMNSKDWLIANTDTCWNWRCTPASMEKRKKRIGYFNRIMKQLKRNYFITYHELSAVINTVEHFQKYFSRREFTLSVDNESLKSF